MNALDIKELIIADKVYTSEKDIINILKENNLLWLLNSETIDAVIELNKKTVIWHEGTYLSGNWKYGIFRNGNFHGNWNNGIWENGVFNNKTYEMIEIQNGVYTLSKKK